MDAASWVAAIGVAISGLAAYFAWQTYRRKPKLKIGLDQDATLKNLRYHHGDRY